MLNDLIHNELKRLEEQIYKLETQIKLLPKGTLICATHGKRLKCYIHEGGHKRYLRKEEHKLTEQLALKKYYTLQLQDYVHEKIALSMYLKHHELYTEKAPKMLLNSLEYQTLLAPHFISFSDQLKKWVNTPYERNSKYPEQLVHKSISGNIVRSKSEALIDMLLYQNHIPYRYENPLIINDFTLYPDFTIMHPKTGQILYWEHFGLMDNPSYAKNTYAKLDHYTANGYIPTIHIITTFETSNYPLTSDLVQKIIEYYFL